MKRGDSCAASCQGVFLARRSEADATRSPLKGGSPRQRGIAAAFALDAI